MTPEQLCQHLRLKPEQLTTACTQARVMMPAAGSVFSAPQIELISQHVAERRRVAAANRTAGGTTGGQVTRDSDAAAPGRATVGGTRGGAATRDGGEKSMGQDRAGTTVGGRAESDARIDTKPGDGSPKTASRSADLSAAVAMLELEDGFQIKKILGKGGMGSVIHAVEKSSGREVAIKRLLSEGSSPKLLNQLVSEYRSTLHLSHPNIVRSYNVYRDSKGPYFSMEYVEGKTLQDRLSAKDAKLSVKEAFEIFVPLADALAHAHSGKKPVVHRDIKPANILLTKGGMAKLADFGIAMEGESSSQNADFVGTVKFMAPEQYVDSRNCNHLSDQYSFAATIYFALTRLPPKDFNPKKVPAAFREFLTRAMQEAPYKRFPSTAEMAQALRDAAPDSHTSKSVGSEKGLDLRVFFGGMAVCLTIVAAMVFIAMRKPESKVVVTPQNDSDQSHSAQKTPVDLTSSPAVTTPPKDIAKATFEMATKHLEGNGVPKNSNEALRLLKESSDLGYSLATSQLAEMYRDGVGVPCNCATAMEYFDKAWKQAQREELGTMLSTSPTNMAELYRKGGTGLAANPFEAMRWYKVVADIGGPLASYAYIDIGEMYLNGEAAARDTALAIEWFEKAADPNFGMSQETARYNLAVIYRDGDGVPKDPIKAAFWFKGLLEVAKGESFYTESAREFLSAQPTR